MMPKIRTAVFAAGWQPNQKAIIADHVTGGASQLPWHILAEIVKDFSCRELEKAIICKYHNLRVKSRLHNIKKGRFWGTFLVPHKPAFSRLFISFKQTKSKYYFRLF